MALVGVAPSTRSSSSRQRLAPKARLVSEIVFNLLALAFCRHTESGSSSGLVWRVPTRDVAAPTILGTPLWIPQSVMLLGTIVLSIALLESLAMMFAPYDRRPRRAQRPETESVMGSGLQLSLVFAVFLGLLAAGMAMPFAIGVSAIVYLVAPWRSIALQGHRADELGQHQQLHADRDPAVHPDGGDHAAQRPQPARLSRPVQAGLRHPGRPAADQHRRLRALRRHQRLERRHRGRDRHAWRCRSCMQRGTTTGACRRARWRPAARSAS